MNKVILLIVLFSSLITLCAHAQTPVASYNFFRDTVDVSGNGNDLSFSGSVISETDYDDCRRYLDMIDNGYMRKDQPTLVLDTALTVIFWMRTNDISTDQKIVGQAAPGSRGFVVGPDNSVIKAEVFGGAAPVLQSHPIDADKWIHVGLVFDSASRYEIYIDGVLDTAHLNPPGWIPSVDLTDDLIIGGAPWEPNELSYTGDLDDLLIYNSALSAVQIDSIYKSTGLCPLSGHPIYVDSSATAGGNNGLTWNNAFTDLQEAIDLSCNCPDADIWVANGTYHPTQDNPFSSDDTDRDVTFFIDHQVKIFGGFTTGAMTLSQRDSLGGGTILTAAIPGNTDTAIHVMYMTADAISNDWEINGLVLRDGQADIGTLGANAKGGGLYAEANQGNNEVVISNCAFTNNMAASGGGAHVLTKPFFTSGFTNSTTLKNCTFSNNTATFNGGGIYMDGKTVTPHILSSSFSNNNSNSKGGGVYIESNTKNANVITTISNSLFTKNTAQDGGGLYVTSVGNPFGISSASSNNKITLSNCTIADNTALANGGALYMTGRDLSNFNGQPESVIAIVNNTILSDNNALAGRDIYKAENSMTGVTNGSINSTILSVGGNALFGSFDAYNDTLHQDPIFVDPLLYDLHLQVSSPGINAGINDSIPAGITTDLDGMNRIVYGTVDMGAYEATFCQELTNNIIYVDSAASGIGLGLDWASAMTDLQEAINFSAACPGVQDIWVAKGTYHPTQDNPVSPDISVKDKTLYINHPVKLFGGFAGTETNLDDRDWKLNITKLDGALSSTDSVFHVLHMDADTIDSDWALDGFYIVNGHASALNGLNSSGGGLKVTGVRRASPDITNCTFSNNKAKLDGGALEVVLSGESSKIESIITACVFKENHAGRDGGAARFESSEFNSFCDPQLINTLVVDNSSGRHGGGISMNHFPDLCSGELTAKIINCTMSDNFAEGDGGALHMNGEFNYPEIFNSIFWANVADDGDDISNIANSDAGGTLSYSTHSQGPGPIEGSFDIIEQNNTLDPALTSTYHLGATSPAINAGNNASIPSDITGDLDGNPRIAYGTVDQGVYESEVLCGEIISGIIYVDIAATGNATGLNWANAMTDLQVAINTAAVCTGTQEIWIAEGTYHPTHDNPATMEVSSRDVTFYIDQPLKIYGGFTSGATMLSDRDSLGGGTILSGAIPNTADTAYHVMYMLADSITSDWVIDGLVIQNGRADITLQNAGGALYVKTSANSGNIDMIISNCTFSGNRANFGGSIHLEANFSNSEITPVFSSCTFEDNYALVQGGAINLSSSLATSPQFINCIFSNNSSGSGGGGAIYALSIISVSPSFLNAKFYNNSGNSGGGIDIVSFSEANPSIVNCTFYNNTAATIGGAINLEATNKATPYISNSIFWDNTATTSGPAIHKSDSNNGLSNGAISHSVMQTSGISGMIDDDASNIEMDPLFVNANIGDLRLQQLSPAINNGNNDSLPAGAIKDLAGNPRILFGTVDMGAFEVVDLCSGITDDIIYVDSAATGNTTGRNWANAMTDLQEAINLSASCPGDQEIWMANGTYHPTHDNPGSTLNSVNDVTFYINHPLKIYGGFTSGATMLTQRDSLGGGTILSGIIPGTTERAYHVMFMKADSISSDWVIDGLVIRDGKARTVAGGNYQGGGLYAEASDGDNEARIANCIFSHNDASQGGGSFMIAKSANDQAHIAPTFTHCIFANNTAPLFAGIYIGADAPNNNAIISPSFVNCNFNENAASSSGGGLSLSATAADLAEVIPSIVNCTFYKNSARLNVGGGLQMGGNSASSNNIVAPVISNSIFWGNTARQGPAINKTDSDNGQSNGSITYSIIEGDSIFGTIDLDVMSNIQMDPLFVDAAAGNLQLQASSPAINAGVNNSLPMGTTTDLLGNDRIDCETVDMGAYEFQRVFEIVCPGPITVDADADACTTAIANVGLTNPTANCAIANVTNDAPAIFPIGNTTVEWVLTGVDGVKDTCDQVVTVVDNQRPTITCPPDITVNADDGACSALYTSAASSIDLGMPITSDNCADETADHNAPASFDVGETMVRWIVTDAAGLTDTCFQKVTVVDNQRPTITCAPDTTITSGVNVVLNSPIVDDNCTGNLSVDNDAPTVFVDAVTTVTWTVTDEADNVNTCEQSVTLQASDPCEDDITISQFTSGQNESYATNKSIFLSAMLMSGDTLELHHSISTEISFPFEIASGGILEVYNDGCP